MTALMPRPESSPDVILASASAARTRLLSEAGVPHICDPANIDENALKQEWHGPTEELAKHLAQEKARVVSARHPGALVLGADQVLALGDEIFDKPGSTEGVRVQLKILCGRTHHLISAVCVVRDGAVLWAHTDSATLTMRAFSDAFLEEYLNCVGAIVTSSVGGYHLEGMGAQLFESVAGDYFTVLGLPLIPLLENLRSHGVLVG